MRRNEEGRGRIHQDQVREGSFLHLPGVQAEGAGTVDRSHGQQLVQGQGSRILPPGLLGQGGGLEGLAQVEIVRGAGSVRTHGHIGTGIAQFIVPEPPAGGQLEIGVDVVNHRSAGVSQQPDVLIAQPEGVGCRQVAAQQPHVGQTAGRRDTVAGLMGLILRPCLGEMGMQTRSPRLRQNPRPRAYCRR